MKLWIDDHVYVYAHDAPWHARVAVATDFYHLIPDMDMGDMVALANVDSRVYTDIEDANPGRCSPERLREHETPRL